MWAECRAAGLHGFVHMTHFQVGTFAQMQCGPAHRRAINRLIMDSLKKSGSLFVVRVIVYKWHDCMERIVCAFLVVSPTSWTTFSLWTTPAASRLIRFDFHTHQLEALDGVTMQAESGPTFGACDGPRGVSCSGSRVLVTDPGGSSMFTVITGPSPVTDLEGVPDPVPLTDPGVPTEDVKGFEPHPTHPMDIFGSGSLGGGYCHTVSVV